MKKVGFILGILLLFVKVPLSEGVVDRVVAVVNQEVITLSEVERGMAPFLDEIRAEDRLEKAKRVREVRQRILNQLIEEKLIDHEIKKSGIKASPKEVETAIEDIKRRNNVTQEELENYLKRDGLTFEAFKQQLEKRILRTKFIRWSVKVENNGGEKELRGFYKMNIDRYRRNESYRPAHILCRVPQGTTPEAIGEIRRKCQKVLDRVKNGENFGELALIYSEDASAKDRGELGVFKKGDLLPAFEKEALRLKVGEVSGLVRTEYGFHIIKLLDHDEGTPIPFEDVKDKVQVDYSESQMEKAFQQFLSSLREKAVIEIRL